MLGGAGRGAGLLMLLLLLHGAGTLAQGESRWPRVCSVRSRFFKTKLSFTLKAFFSITAKCVDG